MLTLRLKLSLTWEVCSLGKKKDSLKPKTFSGTLRTADGSEFLVEVRVSPLEDKA